MNTVLQCVACKGEGFIIVNRFFGLWPTCHRCLECGGVGLVLRQIKDIN